MKLEPIIQSEVSQKGKYQYSILMACCNSWVRRVGHDWAIELNWMHIYEIYKDGNDEPICKTAKETQTQITDFWTLWEKARVGWFERIALKHVYYHMWTRSPVQVWCMRQGAQGWCTGMTLRDGMGWKVGSGWGTFVHLWLIRVDAWQKPLQYCKVISLQLK